MRFIMINVTHQGKKDVFVVTSNHLCAATRPNSLAGEKNGSQMSHGIRADL